MTTLELRNSWFDFEPFNLTDVVGGKFAKELQNLPTVTTGQIFEATPVR